MISSMQELTDYIRDDLESHKGRWYPIKASHFERVFVHKLSVDKLHPNPEDEFCISAVGPSARIINDYREMIRVAIAQGEDPISEKLIVEKIAPSGYMIINGHHRWSAAQLERLKRVPVSIVNLTHDEDLHHMLNSTNREMRVAIDLDQVILTKDETASFEKPVSFFTSLFYKDKLRLGCPTLINALHRMGYDVWVYTRGYHSSEYISKLFKCYNFKVDGIINGVGAPGRTSLTDEAAQEKFRMKYTRSLHIDIDQVSYIDKSTRQFIAKKIEATGSNWSKSVIDIVSSL